MRQDDQRPKLNDFGFGGVLKTALEIYEMASRGSGRSLRTVRSLRPGSVLLVHNSHELRHYADLLKQHRPRVDIKVRVAQRADNISITGYRGTDLVLSHGLWLRIYLDAINRAGRDVEYVTEASLEPEREQVRPVAMEWRN